MTRKLLSGNQEFRLVHKKHKYKLNASSVYPHPCLLYIHILVGLQKAVTAVKGNAYIPSLYLVFKQIIIYRYVWVCDGNYTC